MDKPVKKPANPCFSSGPCAKRPGWSLANLEKHFFAGRSHRAAGPKKQLKDLIEKHRALLKIPADYKIGIVPASDSGAVEMAMWAMLGPRGIDAFAWEAFSLDWLKDITDHMKIKDVRGFEAPYGKIPDMNQYDGNRDCVFAWNGTTSGARVANADWIPADRQGITICDATSAVFAYDMPWDKLDVTTWSWQKVLGSEAAHGMLVLSPRAVERLESYKPDRPLPKIFRVTSKGKLKADIFEGLTINTPSMLAVADCMDALEWVESIGGLSTTIKRCADNFNAMREWVEKTPWIEFLASDTATRSITSVCLVITDPAVAGMPDEDRQKFVKAIAKTLEDENAAYDIASYRDAPAGLRVWCGSTVETADLKALTPWIEWAYQHHRSKLTQKAA